MNRTFTKCIWLLLLVCFAQLATAQQQTTLDAALRYVEQQREKWGLTPADIEDMIVSDQYQSRHNGVQHYYFIQRHMSIKVYNAIMGIHLKSNGDLGYATNRFVTDLAGKVNATEPQLTAHEAIAIAARHVGLPLTRPLQMLNKISDREMIFEGADVSHSDIKVELYYQPNRETGAVRLAWNLAIEATDSPDYWSLRVDALTGEILQLDNWTIYCSFSGDSRHEHDDQCRDEGSAFEKSFQPVQQALEEEKAILSGNTYNVFPIPVESPIHGPRELVVDPHDLEASPFGWHDTNGTPGPEFTFTRGNNVHAYIDANADNAPDGPSADGGANLVFDFPFDDTTQEPPAYKDAAMTQLFYMNNIMHDFTYAYGFNEQAGNFQQNNYGNGGQGNDYVFAEAQDGSGTNNANFSTPADGANGRMQMFLWDQAGGRLVNILEPEEIAGGYESTIANFGPPITSVPLIGELALATDGTSNGTLGCNTIVNTADVAGKIAIVDRGTCFFEQKVVNVQAAGAIACIICNNQPGLAVMGGRPDIPDPTIPTAMLTQIDCQLIKQLLGASPVTASLVLPEDAGPDSLDGDFDNGIIAHEYGHGISNRLTGGPSQAGCLNNNEQMGEGWSDFFALVTTVEPDDVGEMGRGIGNYVLRGGVNGIGIRRYPYSTNPLLNSQVYDDIITTGTSPHNLGEIWASVLWDLYWAMVDVYGYDPDLYYGTGGNNKAIQLVMDGMKYQSCNPGMIDGRDAILVADEINYNGENQCLIWDVFARRGLGYSALQGSSEDRTDNIQAFDRLPECAKELKVAKSVTPLVEAGDEVTITLTATNHKDEAVTNVTIVDELPAGMTFIPGSVTNNITATPGAGAVTFNIGTLAAGASTTFLYRVNTSPDFYSIRQLYDDMENGEDLWNYQPLDDGIAIWELIDAPGEAYSGDHVWFVASTPADNDQVLENLEPITITGDKPVLRFFHRYDTEPAIDGGLVMVSTDNGFSWSPVDQYMIRGDYRGKITYSTFATLDLGAFWGTVPDYFGTYVDLSDYIGQEVLIRFRWGTDEEASGETTGTGWYVDDFELMDMFNYNGEACITSAEGDLACTIAPEGGTIVESKLSTSTEEVLLSNNVKVYPNPTRDLLNVAFTTQQTGPVTVEVLNADGRVMLKQTQRLDGGRQVLPLNVAALAGGFYFVKISTDNETVVEKVVIR